MNSTIVLNSPSEGFDSRQFGSQLPGSHFTIMSNSRATRTVVIGNPEGLHARPAQLLARTALEYKSQVELVNGTMRVDAKSILHVLTLGAQQGTQLTIEANGEDAEHAVEALERLITSGFAVADTVQTERANSQKAKTETK